MNRNTYTISISSYWNDFLVRIVQAGMRQSKAQVVQECLAARRKSLEQELADYEDYKAERKEKH